MFSALQRINRMPIYEFECDAGHHIENYYAIGASAPHSLQCINPLCPLIMGRIWSRLASYIATPAAVVFRDRQTGQVYVPEANNIPTPEGYIREEYQGLAQRTALEKKLQQEATIANDMKEIGYNNYVNLTRKARHDKLKAEMSSNAAKCDNPTAYKEALGAAMTYTGKKKKKVPPRPETFIKVNHMDRSNLK